MFCIAIMQYYNIAIIAKNKNVLYCNNVTEFWSKEVTKSYQECQLKRQEEKEKAGKVKYYLSHAILLSFGKHLTRLKCYSKVFKSLPYYFMSYVNGKPEKKTGCN